MRRVVVYLLMSVDGVVEAPDQWVFEFDADMYENLENILARQDDVLLGRAMYEEWSQFWPTSTDEPFASFINATPKHVATSNADPLSWANSSRIAGSVVDYVNALKQSSGRDIGVHGSITLAESLLSAGLVDELQFVVAPALAGSGRRFTNMNASVHRLSLEHSMQSASGAMLLAYSTAS